jgi:Zn-dependent M28 family amino/carboxypeptidase
MGIVTGRQGVIWAGTLGWVLLAYPILPAVIYGLFFTRANNRGGTVPGAADNLSACGIAVALCRFLVQHPEHIPADTEIRFITFGGEEAGLRGSRRYVERHLRELKLLDARLVNVETVAHPDIVILSSEASGTVQNSP